MPLGIIPASALIVGAAIVLTARLPLRGTLERLGAAFLLSQAVLTVTLLLGGVVLASLDPLLVLALSALAFGLALAATGAYRQADRVQIWSGAKLGGRRAWRAMTSDRAVALLALAVLGALAWRTVLALRLPLLQYDDFSYHTLIVDVWLQTDHIGRVPHRIWTDGYPANSELLTLWLMLFSTSDALARLTSLLPVPLAGVATAGLARTFGADRRWAVLAGLLVMALPVVLIKADSTYVDNLVMATIAAAWFFGLRAIRERERGRSAALYLVAGVAIGLGVGTKVSSFVPLGAVGVTAMAVIWVRRPIAVRTAVVETAAIGVPTVLLGSYWYLRNLAVHGNPLWPFTFGPFEGRGTVEELIVRTPPEFVGTSPWFQLATSWLADVGLRTYAAEIRLGGFGLPWPFLLALGGAGLILLARNRQLVPIAMLCLPALVAVAITPMVSWLRYTLFVPVLVAALAALAMSRVPRWSSGIAAILVVLALGSLAMAHRTANFAPEPGGGRPGIASLVRLVLADEDQRMDVSYWRDCREFRRIPSGARVGTDGFNLLHLVAGHDIDRVLMQPFGANADLHAALTRDGIRATHVALISPPHIEAAKADPRTFEWLGPVCRGVELFAVR